MVVVGLISMVVVKCCRWVFPILYIFLFGVISCFVKHILSMQPETRRHEYLMRV